MKSASLLLVTSLFISILLEGCVSRESYTLKMTIAPEQINSSSNPEDLEDASSIIRKRLNDFGIKDEEIELNVSREEIIMSINGIDTGMVESIKGIITTTGKLEFWETYENTDIFEYLTEANHRSRDLYQNPLFSILYPHIDGEGKPLQSCLIGFSVAGDTGKVMRLLKKDEINILLPRNLKLMWSRKPYKYDETGKFYELHAIKISTLNGLPKLDGESILSVKAVTGKRSPDVRLNLEMNSEGSHNWRRMTQENINLCIAVSLDGKVITYPRVMNEITNGETEITGDFSLAEAQYLAAVLSSGGILMPYKLKISDQKLEKIKK